MPILLFFLAHWFISIFVQTFYHHRYASHKMFTMNKFWERSFHFLSYASQGSSYLVPRAYAIMHRMHHAYSDTEQDPHSPNFFKDIFSMMIHTAKIYDGLIRNALNVPANFLGNYPTWDRLDKFGNGWTSRLLWAGGYVVFYAFFATSWWMYLLLPIHFLMGPIHGAAVNWCGHKYGYQNFDNGDDSRNTLPFDLLLMGELFQNNHHKHPNSPNFGAKPWEFDPVYPMLRLLHRVGIIQLRRA